MKTNQGIKVTSGIKAGGWNNHNRALKVTSGIKAGGWNNHNRTLLG